VTTTRFFLTLPFTARRLPCVSSNCATNWRIPRFLNGVEVFALEVFDERHLQHGAKSASRTITGTLPG
jgi:hypothetical protein